MQSNVILENQHALLRPMQPGDVAGFREIAFDPEIWRFFIFAIANEADLTTYVSQSLQAHNAEQRVVFTIVDQATGRIAGSTSFGNFSAPDRRVEIGWSWLAPRFHGSPLNRSCKFLLFRHAFERENLARVELKTDVLNVRARRAMQKVGCTEEGILRSHTVMPGGRRRDTIYYSLLASEWPRVKEERFAGLG
jgi:RimJ/RimL family protein N-acetyltransferase